MADITWAHVVDHAAELSTVDADAQTDILAFVNAALDVSLLDGEAGPRTKLARVYLAAHFGTMSSAGGTGGAGGPVTAESLGDETRSYGTWSMSGSALATTGYGQAYLSLINTSAARGPFLL